MKAMSLEEFFKRYNERTLQLGSVELIGNTVMFFTNSSRLTDRHVLPYDSFDSSWTDPVMSLSLEDCVRDNLRVQAVKVVRRFRKANKLDDSLTTAYHIVMNNWDEWVEICEKGGQ
jgi:hypothetical protein